MPPEGVIFTAPMASGLLLGKPREFHRYLTLHFIRQQHLMVCLCVSVCDVCICKLVHVCSTSECDVCMCICMFMPVHVCSTEGVGSSNDLGQACVGGYIHYT